MTKDCVTSPNQWNTTLWIEECFARVGIHILEEKKIAMEAWFCYVVFHALAILFSKYDILSH